jgi:hypothetical protein
VYNLACITRQILREMRQVILYKKTAFIAV